MRRKPFGKLLPSAHAVDREYKVITALHAQGFDGNGIDGRCGIERQGLLAQRLISSLGRRQILLGEIKDAHDAGRVVHAKNGPTWYVRSKRDGTYRKPSDWLTAKEKKEAPVSSVTDLRQKAQSATALPPASSPTRAPPPTVGKVARTTAGLRDALFDALDELRGPKPDVAKALATAKIAQAIIGSAKAELDFRTRLNQDKQLDTDFKDGTLRLGSEPA